MADFPRRRRITGCFSATVAFLVVEVVRWGGGGGGSGGKGGGGANSQRKSWLPPREEKRLFFLCPAQLRPRFLYFLSLAFL